MFTKLLVGAAALVAVAAPATAATFTVSFNSAPIAIAANNDFLTALAGLGANALATGTISLDGPGRVTFEYLGSESGFRNTFAAGSVTGTEIDSNNFASPILLGTAVFGAGAFAPTFFSNGAGAGFTPGSAEFGLFVPSTSTATPYSANVLYFGFDDNTSNPDDNHDDFIIRATVGAVPEASTWALMIAGFGLVGVAMRRRAGITAVAA